MQEWSLEAEAGLPRTSVGWGGGSSGHEPGKAVANLEKNNLKTDSQRRYNGRMADVLLGKRNSRERTKI